MPDIHSATSGHKALRGVLSHYCFGRDDPTTRLTDGQFWRATLTPDGAGTLHLDWRDGALKAVAYGPGAEWLLARVPAIIGALDPGHVFHDAHPSILAAQRNHPYVRFGASGTLYHELLPVILGQRITAGEAIRQWHLLVRRLGDVAPGPRPDLSLPPSPARLAAQPLWWFHPLGIEAKRAGALREVARRERALHEWAGLDAAAAGERLALLPGIGPWTVASVLATAMGDPDSLAVGDYHLKHAVVHALTGRARGTDDEMLALLAPYAGQRARAARLLLANGAAPAKFGPRRRVLPMSRW